MSSTRKDITQFLSEKTKQYIDPHNDQRIYWAREVTFDYATSHSIRIDFMQYKPLNNTISGIEKGDFYCYEVKSSLEDFHSKNGHNFIGDYNYYIMLEEVYEKVKTEIPYHVGVLVPDMTKGLRSIKRAVRKNREKAICEMLLMMYRSCRRDIDE